MRKLILAALPLALVAAPAMAARAVKVIEPLAAGVAGVGAVHVVSTTVTIGETARPILAKLEEKAAAKRASAGLPPIDAAAAGTRPSPETYEALPFATMMPLEIEDVTRDWGLTAGRPVKLAVTIDSIKTADAGVAMLIGSSDELAGTVDVLDAADDRRLGQFYVDVLNFRSGMLGLALRGSGVREKLAGEFAKHIAEQLSGTKSKPKKSAK